MSHHILLAGSFTETLPFGLRRIGDKISNYTDASKVAQRRKDRIEKIVDKHDSDGIGIVIGDKIVGETNLAKAYTRGIRQKAAAMQASAELGIPVVTIFDSALPLQFWGRLQEGTSHTLRVDREVISDPTVTHIVLTQGWENDITGRDIRRTAEIEGKTVVDFTRPEKAA